MPLREFTDDAGRRWRAWAIKPEEIHPATKAEDFLADCYITGWIVFETVVQDEKRRLCPWPTNWMEIPEQDLRGLLGKAEVVPPHRLRAQQESGALAAESRPPGDRLAELDITDLKIIRTFFYPGGGRWQANVITYPDDGGPAVLRFSAGRRFLDLRQWPKDWSEHPDEKLVDMLRRAGSRRESVPPAPGTPRRRWDDQRSASR
jgi:hypothetical protein